MKRSLDVLLIFDYAGPPPADRDYTAALSREDYDGEAQVLESLEELGHRVRLLALYDDITPLVEELKHRRPDLVFNLVELFHDRAHLDHNIAAVLELFGVAFTGCGSAGMLISNDKGLSKSILTYHRIRVPRFVVLHRAHRIRRPRRVRFPLVVKPLREEASRGISQASYVTDDAALQERVAFIHERFRRDAIAEEYIEGRELYVSILGRRRLTVLPLREMVFGQIPDDEPHLATEKAKWDPEYRKRWGIKNTMAKRLPDGVERRIQDVCKRAYRVLGLTGYARFDIRLTPDHEVVVLEANPNPDIAWDDEFGHAAMRGGLSFTQLIDTIVRLGMSTAR